MCKSVNKLNFFSVQEIILHAKSLNRFNFQHIKKIWNTFVVLGLVWSDQDERIDGHWHWMEMYLDILNKLLHEQQLSYLYHILTSAVKSTTGHKLACEFLVDISIHQFVEESLYILAKVFLFVFLLLLLFFFLRLTSQEEKYTRQIFQKSLHDQLLYGVPFLCNRQQETNTPCKILYCIILPSITHRCKFLANQFLLLDQFIVNYQQIFTFASRAKTYSNIGLKN